MSTAPVKQFGEERLARVLSQDLGELPSAQQVIDVVTDQAILS